MYVYIFSDGGVYKSDEFHQALTTKTKECLFVGVGTLKEYVGGEWAEVEIYQED